MNDKKTTIKEKLNQIRATTAAFVGGLTAEQWETPVFSEGSDWTVADLFRHVVDSERGMTTQIDLFRQGHEGVPADFDLARWNARVVAKSKEKTPAILIEEMGRNRENLLKVIDSLADEDWDKSGRHASLRILSIEQICHLIADHEGSHVEDMKRMVG